MPKCTNMVSGKKWLPESHMRLLYKLGSCYLGVMEAWGCGHDTPRSWLYALGLRPLHTGAGPNRKCQASCQRPAQGSPVATNRLSLPCHQRQMDFTLFFGNYYKAKTELPVFRFYVPKLPKALLASALGICST